MIENGSTYTEELCKQMTATIGVSSWRSCVLRSIALKGLTQFRIKGKLKSRYIGPFEILLLVGVATYRLALPLKLSYVNDMLHASTLRKYKLNPSHVISFDDIEFEEYTTYVEKQIMIVAREERKL